ncbi:MAG: YidC/Oxa1 family membrane protein insertase [Clostridiales bacterium]|nr:YidC/Oxa1 family membrane protein insertase [Clostridiales bacterium]MDD7367281.1 YidC/Oxa1 family membrane protein insertase [Clostridiales bacterium]MDY2871733.1 YidC/Oxa1 family membrane protein insertase [Eubacteriales bacterium]
MRLGFIGDILRWALDLIYSLVGNYGWAVLIFTLLIRLVLMPLDIKSRKSMKAMQNVQPKIDELNKKYANDKDKLNQKMADLYKKEKINPLSGCLPMLIQLPILFAMFAVMREVANEETIQMILEIKQNILAGIENYQPKLQSLLWIKNVFQPDSFMSTVVPAFGSTLPEITKASGTVTMEMIEEAKAFLQTNEYSAWAANYGNAVAYSAPLLMWTITIPKKFNGLFILPIFSAVSQFFTSKFMNAGQQSSNAQQASTNKFMQWFFPLFSLWICASSNAAFALYWVFINVFQIAQQFIIGKLIDRSENKKKLIEEASTK